MQTNDDLETKLTPLQWSLYALLNPVEKLTANYFISGLGESESYKRACVDVGLPSPGDNASKLARRIFDSKHVKNYIWSIIEVSYEAHANKSVMDREEALQRLTTIVRTKLTDIIDWQILDVTTKGNVKLATTQITLRNRNELTEAQLSCIKKLYISKGQIRVELYDTTQAMQQLSVMQGWNAAEKYIIEADDKTLTPWNDIEAFVDDDTTSNDNNDTDNSIEQD